VGVRIPRRPLAVRSRASLPLLAVTVVLGVVLAVAVGVQGAPTGSGVRWVPHLHLHPRTVQPVQQTGFATQQPVPSRPAVSGGGSRFPLVPILVVLAVVVVVLALVLVWRWWRARPRRAALADDPSDVVGGDAVETPEPAPEPDAPTLLRGLALARRVLDEDRRPDDAIVAAWLGLQEAAEDSGIRRRAAETPTEFASRIIVRTSTDAAAAQALLRLYLRVRFGGHEATTADVAAARECVVALEAAWRDPAAGRSR
jgi:hypothetical protein